jgi:hypothetical protein
MCPLFEADIHTKANKSTVSPFGSALSLSLSSQSLNKIMREIIRPEDTTERDEQ